MSAPSTNNNSSSSSSNAGPPPDNPILNAYETFQRDTPTITRTVMTTQAFAWTISFFVDLTFGLANIPFFTIMKLEVYRIITNLFICSNFISLIFAFFSFVETGKRMEYSMGSTEFISLFLTIGIVTNVLYIAIAAFLDTLFGTEYWFHFPSFGIWIVLFGVIAMECTKAPQGSRRKIFLFNVPTLYYPLALLGLFSLIGGFSLAYLISIGVGYAFGFGYLDKLRINNSRCKRWEDSFLDSLTQHEGWVLANAALGSGAWNEEIMMRDSGSSGNNTATNGGFGNIFSQLMSQNRQQQSYSLGGSSVESGIAMGSEGHAVKTSPQTVTTLDVSLNSALPTTGGKPLGGASRRTNADPRQARLKALDRRTGSYSSDHDQTV